ncbi:hypothetical protein F4V57_09765 [Acinetobacter qingfengensis]|uniref:Uncharacterized protein n=1 Tax=Acinetobacter qingfengensis TaxID=1262585 RepID=A0A1E7RCX5_9GAMM|nr:hypothetical protein [Acinetobacter qingfengensis]KAA8732350.1 hypothetical protein F4V57_09765 [Acinetobacter qingfengensis]OEY97259.1 hypothetical protein BJI46_02230 [Acinetobacter qingfengensis]
MNKLLWFLLIILSVWTIKLSVEMYQLQNNQLNVLDSRFDQQTQRIDRLNDQIIALQNQKVPVVNHGISKVAPQSVLQNNRYTVQNYIVDHLQLIQLTLQQQDFVAALEQIQTLRHKISQDQPLSESLNVALLDALAKDQMTLVNFLQQRTEQQTILQQQLHAIEREIHPQPLDQPQKKWLWSSWFSISKVDDTPDLKSRALHYQYLKLQLLLAQQALSAGQTVFYQTMLKEIVIDLRHYPDDLSKNMAVSLSKLSNTSLIAPPKLTALALLQGG